MRASLLAMLLPLAATQEAVPARLVAATRNGGLALVVEPGPGVRLSARAAPTLELPDGRVVRLDHGAVTADSAYFATAPWGPHPSGTALRGTLRVGYCRAHERFCRTAALHVEVP